MVGKRGLGFIETVDTREPQRCLSFSIRPTTFDEHVRVRGRVFDVLRGTDELHSLQTGCAPASPPTPASGPIS